MSSEIVLFVKVKIAEAHVDDFIEAYSVVARATRKETGNRVYDIHRHVDDPTSFHFYEIFASEEALAEHSEADYLKTFFAKVGPWLEGEPAVVRAQKLDV